MKISNSMLQKLLEEIQRTNVGSIAFVKNGKGVPEGMTYHVIERWKSGAKTAQKEYWDWTIKEYRKLPDNGKNTRRPVNSSSGRIKISDQLREELRELHIIAPAGYLDQEFDNFSPVKMAHVLSGRSKTIPKDVLYRLRAIRGLLSDHTLSMSKSKFLDSDGHIVPDLTLKEISEFPLKRPEYNSKPRSVAGVEYIEISEDIYNHLHNEIRRTLVSHTRLLRALSDVPKGLTTNAVHGWRTGKIRSGEKSYIDYIFDSYTKQPNAS